jgi:hypothetical protein
MRRDIFVFFGCRQRFISPDPSGFAGGDPNLYAYVGNSPTNSVDPLGLGGGGWSSICENCTTKDLLHSPAAAMDPYLSSTPGSYWATPVFGTWGPTIEQTFAVFTLPDA